jgi:PilZ domain
MENNTERRRKPRINCDYPVIVEGTNGDGKKYQEDARLANLSASGLFMVVPRHVDYGNTLTMTILLAIPDDDEETPKISANGTVVRTEPRTDGTCGVAVKFKGYRFL